LPEIEAARKDTLNLESRCVSIIIVITIIIYPNPTAATALPPHDYDNG